MAKTVRTEVGDIGSKACAVGESGYGKGRMNAIGAVNHIYQVAQRMFGQMFAAERGVMNNALPSPVMMHRALGIIPFETIGHNEDDRPASSGSDHRFKGVDSAAHVLPRCFAAVDAVEQI